MSLLQRVVVGALVVGTLGTVGCGASARYMLKNESPQPMAAPPDKALVVFVRPSNYAFAVSANILDEGGRFVGDAVAGGNFAVALPPGQHTFVSWAENTDALVANLAPGKIYFVEVYVTMGAFSAHFHMRAIKPSSANWSKRDQWMAGTSQYRVDFQAGNAALSEKGADKIQERLRRGQEHMTKYDERDRFERTLDLGDGV